MNPPPFEPVPGVVVHLTGHTARVDGKTLSGGPALVAVAARVEDATALARAAVLLVDDSAAEPWMRAIGGAYPPDVEAMASPPARTGMDLVYWRVASGQVADLARCSVRLDTGAITCVNGASLRPPETLLQSDNVYVRISAVAGLEARNDATSILNMALNEQDHRVREAAVVALGRMKPRSAVGDVGRILLFDGYPSVRAAAAKALGEIGDPAAKEALQRAQAGDADAAVRAASTQALSRL